MASFDEVSASGGALALHTVAVAAVTTLESGGLLAHPTATVYGIGGPNTPEAEAAIAVLKGRSERRPMLRLVPDVETAHRVFPGLVWTSRAEKLARDLWPGPVTLVLDDGTDTGVAIRVESHPLLREVLRGWGNAMSSTSLNVTGAPPAVTPHEVRVALAGFPTVELSITFLEAGVLPGAPPSTVISLRSGEVRLVREGAVARERIEMSLGEEIG